MTVEQASCSQALAVASRCSTGLFLAVEIQPLKRADTCLRSKEGLCDIAGSWRQLKLEGEIGLT